MTVQLVFTSVGYAEQEDFLGALARVDHAIRKNPTRVSVELVESCRARRNFAIKLYDVGQATRARRSLNFCFEVLGISATPPKRAAPVRMGPSMAEIEAKAAEEIDKALALTPNIDNGLEIYRSCAMCHTPEGAGLSNGSVPQIAGQHRKVVIKQLADLRAGNRDSVLMIPYATVESIGGAQGVADVAGYIDTLEIHIDSGKGTGKDLDLGKRLYAENCARCHGDNGEGNDGEFVPRIQSQHYNYLVRQFEWIRSGRRRNANTEMVEQIEKFEDHEVHAVLDYVSRLEPPPEFQAPADWENPDFSGNRPWSASAR